MELSSGFDLKCNFTDYKYNWGRSAYTCCGVEVKLEEPNVAITNVIGDHLVGNVIDDTSYLLIENQIVRFLPSGIPQKFRNLKALIISGSQLQQIQRINFDGLENLKVLLLDYNDLKVIPEDVFDNLANLEFLSLCLNGIESLSESTFNGLGSLKRLFLHENKIERLGGKIFANNPKLEVIWLQGNKLKFIGADIFSPTIAAKEVFLGSNVCIHSWFPGPSTLEELTELIINRCSEVNSELFRLH